MPTTTIKNLTKTAETWTFDLVSAGSILYCHCDGRGIVASQGRGLGFWIVSPDAFEIGKRDQVDVVTKKIIDGLKRTTE